MATAIDGAKTEETTIHKNVLSSLKGEKITINGKEYDFLIEEQGSRLDLPRDLNAPEKERGQRNKNLVYVDAALCDGSKQPRMFIEIVDSSPRSPNGIVGLVINLDRVAKKVDRTLDLLFIVLGEMSAYCCSCFDHRNRKEHGHWITPTPNFFPESWEAAKRANSPWKIFREGVEMNYRKALLEYPIGDYLKGEKGIRPPSVLFVNRTKVRDEWEAYEPIVLSNIKTHISQRLGNADRNSEAIFDRIEELFPKSIRERLAT